VPGETMASSGTPYLRIVGGNLVQKVDEGTEGSKIRKWELADGTKGETCELSYVNWTGIVYNVSLKDTDYGEQCIITLDDAVITLNTTSRYFQDFACKIHSADLSKPITFHPYDMEIDGKKKTGISMYQGDKENKLKNYFYDGQKNLHGFPVVDLEKSSKKSYWKKYFLDVIEFLCEKLEDLKFPNKPEFALDEFPEKENTKEVKSTKKEEPEPEPEQQKIPDDLPWEK